MPNYNQAHQFYAGVDLHARSMFVHVLSAKGKTVFERDLPAEPDAFLDAGALPTLHDKYGISTVAMTQSIKGWLN